MADEVMFVHTERLPSVSQHTGVPVHTPLGSAVDGSRVRVDVGSESVALRPYQT